MVLLLMSVKGLERRCDTKENAWMGGYKLVFNARGVGTWWEVPYLWPGQKSTAEWTKPSDISAKENAKEKAKEKSSKPRLASREKWAGVSFRVGYLLLNFLLICCYYVRSRPSRRCRTKRLTPAFSCRNSSLLANCWKSPQQTTHLGKQASCDDSRSNSSAPRPRLASRNKSLWFASMKPCPTSYRTT